MLCKQALLMTLTALAVPTAALAAPDILKVTVVDGAKSATCELTANTDDTYRLLNSQGIVLDTLKVSHPEGELEFLIGSRFSGFMNPRTSRERPVGLLTYSGSPRNDAEALENEATRLSRRDFATAFDLYSQAIALEPENPRLWGRRAMLSFNAGKYAEALKDAQKASAIARQTNDRRLSGFAHIEELVREKLRRPKESTAPAPASSPAITGPPTSFDTGDCSLF